jgi:hypothetical protein
MVAGLELTQEEFLAIAAAFAHFRLGDEPPPSFVPFLTNRLRPNRPALADRLANASPEDIDQLVTRLRLHQSSPE